ncbi:DUF1775 domain-containing protein [Micromonospora sp. CPCC 205556]|uniref:DUF1775 domain-containing protein n=1 Tax=Micromonospora sp. CPCC 205556 TaxID=3122398 RepID=UPI002FEEE187
MATTRGGSRRTRAGAVLAATVAGVLGWPGAAQAAEVTTTPTRAVQGGAVEVTFVVPEERPGTRTRKIEVRLPADAPVGEVYPLSVDGWAPLMTSRTLDEPVAGIHSDGVTSVTAAVTWTRAAGAPSAGPARLPLAMGPLPQADTMRFEVVQTYADGTVVRWADPAGGAHPAPTLTLLPAAPGAVTGHAHGGDAGAAADPAAAPGPAEAGPSANVLLGGGLLIGVGGGAVIGWAVSRGRHRADPTDDPDDAGDAGGPAADEPAEGARPPGERAEPVGSR